MIAPLIFCALLAGLALFQAALVAGAPLGRFAWGGQHRVLPSQLRIGSIVSIVLYALFAVIVLDRAGLWRIDLLAAVRPYLIWVLAAYMGIGIVMNAISRSRPEQLVMTPVAAVLAACGVVVALTPD